MRFREDHGPVLMTIARGPQAIVPDVHTPPPRGLALHAVLGVRDSGPDISDLPLDGRAPAASVVEPSLTWLAGYHAIEAVPLLGPDVLVTDESESDRLPETLYVSGRPSLHLVSRTPMYHPSGAFLALGVRELDEAAARTFGAELSSLTLRARAPRLIMAGRWRPQSEDAITSPPDRLVIELQERGGRTLPRQPMAVILDRLPPSIGTGRPSVRTAGEPARARRQEATSDARTSMKGGGDAGAGQP